MSGPRCRLGRIVQHNRNSSRGWSLTWHRQGFIEPAIGISVGGFQLKLFDQNRARLQRRLILISAGETDKSPENIGYLPLSLSQHRLRPNLRESRKEVVGGSAVIWTIDLAALEAFIESIHYWVKLDNPSSGHFFIGS